MLSSETFCHRRLSIFCSLSKGSFNCMILCRTVAYSEMNSSLKSSALDCFNCWVRMLSPIRWSSGACSVIPGSICCYDIADFLVKGKIIPNEKIAVTLSCPVKMNIHEPGFQALFYPVEQAVVLFAQHVSQGSGQFLKIKATRLKIQS